MSCCTGWARSWPRISEELAAHLKAPAPLELRSWEDAVDTLLELGRDRPVAVVLDEFPYLCRANPALPSVVQRAFGPRRPQRLGSRTRLLLCGSAMSFMGALLSGSAPLRGRAGLDLTVPTFGFRLAARFWGIDDPALAVAVHAIVGGTPAYRREYVRGDTPRSPQDFDSWVTRTVLDPACPLFKEARYLLAEEPDLRDKGIYHSVLAAIAGGNARRRGIASYVGRADDKLSHPLTVLEHAGLVVREEDAFHSGRTSYRIAEPLVAFYHAVMRPEWGRLERPGAAAQVWSTSRARFHGAILGPHFEQLARVWTDLHAAPDTLGDRPTLVRSGTVADPAERRTHQLDVVAMRTGDGTTPRLLAIGEAKWGSTPTMEHLHRLERVRALLTAKSGVDTSGVHLLCFSGRGFSADLRRAARDRTDVVLVDPARLYHGD